MTVRFLTGEVRAQLRTLKPKSIHCVVTSPPYWGLRDYGVAGQIGLEPTWQEFVQTMVNVFREIKRVLRDDGTIWLNLGDSYATSVNGRAAETTKAIGNDDRTFRDKPFSTVQGVLKAKDICGIPWRVAFALQEDGWFLRQDIIWAKPNPMPESILDRCTKAHEYIFLLSKSPHYYFDHELIKEPASQDEYRPTFRGGAYVKGATFKNSSGGKSMVVGNVRRSGNKVRKDATERGAPRSGIDGSVPWEGNDRHKRSVWTVATAPFPEAHFATFPPALIEPCILAGTSEKGCCSQCGAPWQRIMVSSNPSKADADTDTRGWANTHSKTANPQSSKSLHRNNGGVYSSAKFKGWKASCACKGASIVPCTVLDPFGGAGTTALVADIHKRNAVLIELNPKYMNMAKRRIKLAHADPYTQEIAKRLKGEPPNLGPLFSRSEQNATATRPTSRKARQHRTSTGRQ